MTAYSGQGVNGGAGGIVNVRPFLHSGRLRISRGVLVFRESLREIVGGRPMDYIIAGIACVGLFLYLIYALLRPERF
jgi:K+-transporting ATPase KdpF subunit